MRAPLSPTLEPFGGAEPVRWWLAFVAGLVAATAIVGAATRLTGSGLSITEWAPIMGVVPPLSDAQWQEAFDRYREIPQYKLINKGMSLDGFRGIFWWEWSHRLLARSIGVVFLLPLLWFMARRAIPRHLLARLWLLLGLGGLQGAVGWYMVRSGLVDRVDVSQYRLAVHLGLAALIFAGLIWTLLDLMPERDEVRLATVSRRQRLGAAIVAGLVFLQILLGALVAGLKAGRTYNTWPLMDGALLPAGLLQLTPWWINAFENAATVQLNHRLMAYLVVVMGLLQAWRVMRSADDERVRISGLAVAVLIFAQAALGVWTLLAWVPLGLGVAHQAGALATLAAAIWHLHTVRRATRI